MDYATLRLTITPEGAVSAQLINQGGSAPYDLAVIADDIADALNAGGLEGSLTRLRQIEAEVRQERGA